MQGGAASNTIHDHFSTYFESADIGAVPWQDSKI